MSYTEPMDFPTAPRDGDTQADIRNTAVPGAHAAMADYRSSTYTRDKDGDNGLPDVSRYPTYLVGAGDMPVGNALVNPSAGLQGPTEGAGKYGPGGAQLFDAGSLNNRGGSDINAQGATADPSVAADVRAAMP
jgi:hypothetical protein